MDSTVRVVGAAELDRSLRSASENLGRMTKAGTAAAAAVVARAAQSAPRRSGRLAASLHVLPAAVPPNVGEAVADVPYAGVIEYGWPDHRISPQPYVRPAIDEVEPLSLAEFDAEAQKIMDTVKGA